MENGGEASWSLGSTCTREPGFHQICNLNPGLYTLICTDSFGNGWSISQVTVQGVTFCENFNDGYEMLVQLNITRGGVMTVPGK